MTDSVSLDTAVRIIEIVSFVGAGLGIIFKMGKMTERFELIGKQQAKEITELKTEVKALSNVMTLVAVQKERLDSQAERLNLLDQRYEDLRHGEGFVFPLGSHPGKRDP